MADPARLADTGARVRSRLLAHPRARPAGGHRADLFTVPGFLTAQQCSALIAEIDAGATPSTLFRDGDRAAVDGALRTSSTHYFPPQGFALQAGEAIDALTGMSRSHAEPLQGQRYRVGEQYRHHTDVFRVERDHWQRERLRGGQRTWTVMVYLNTVESGGATDFPRLGMAIRPETGLLVAWNNLDRRGRPNPALLHAGQPVSAGAKYVITQWYRLAPWSAAPASPSGKSA